MPLDSILNMLFDTLTCCHGLLYLVVLIVLDLFFIQCHHIFCKAEDETAIAAATLQLFVRNH